MSTNHPTLKSLRVETVTFRRGHEDAIWEDGIIVNYRDGLIIDMDGKVVASPIHDFRVTSTNVMTVFSDEES